uniref:PPM-type phosphatase domain-containing protein n=1 Tax=Globisporangium ultimum (strain ATCC 200006 / CBS 805.95 / DAOM BR144) TaxID=431595 RepID=K3WZA9_GLOUD
MDESTVSAGVVVVRPASAGAAVSPSSSSPSSPASPAKGNTLLQRQVSRALEMIELYDDATLPGEQSAMVGGLSSASAPTAAHVPYRALKNVKKCPKTIFQISPNAVKRKRSHSMSSITNADHVNVESFRASIELAEKHVLMRKRNNTGSVKKPRDGRVTPSKRCSTKAKEKKREKHDVIENALKKFHADQLEQDARCFEFTSICHSGTPSNVNDSATASSTSMCSSAERRDDAASKMRVQVGVAFAQGARAYMEDRFSVVDRLIDDLDDPDCSPSLLAVYDGHNGAMAAEYATTRFKELLGTDEFLRDVSVRTRHEKLSDDDIEKIQMIMCEAFIVVDDEILELTMNIGKRDGSTVLLGLLIGGKLFVANLGDSRGVWSKADDEVVRVSVDHKPDLDEETKRVEEAGGKVIYSGCWRVAHDEIPLRLAISRSLGDHPLKTNLPLSCSAPLVSVTPDIQILDAGGADEFLVFASDGLWDRLSDEDAAQLVKEKLKEFKASAPVSGGSTTKEALQFAADALVESALQKRSMDNITAMVISWAANTEAFSADEVTDA